MKKYIKPICVAVVVNPSIMAGSTLPTGTETDGVANAKEDLFYDFGE